jgi:opacity protein-like surface antigen
LHPFVENLQEMKLQSTWKNVILLLLTGTALITNEVKAQSKSPIHFGLKGGANSSSLSLSGSNLDARHSLGYHAGIFTRVDFSKVYVQGELLYSQKKSKVENGSAGTQQVKWNSIEVPVVVGYKILRSEDVTLRIFGGGVYSHTLNEKASILKQVSQSFDKFDKSNIGYQAGAGVDIGRLTFDMKYEGALTSISNQFKARPNTFHASIGFMIF